MKIQIFFQFKGNGYELEEVNFKKFQEIMNFDTNNFLDMINLVEKYNIQATINLSDDETTHGPKPIPMNKLGEDRWIELIKNKIVTK